MDPCTSVRMPFPAKPETGPVHDLYQRGLPRLIVFRRSFIASIHILSFVVLAAILVGTQGSISFAAETLNSNGGRDLQSIVDDGVLRVAMTRFDLPAFHQARSDGSVIGLEADLARALAQAMLRLRLTPITDHSIR